MHFRSKFLILAASCLITITSQAATMNVQVQDGVVRATPTFLGKPVTKVQYGNQVQTIQLQGEWYQVSVQGQTGWIHQSALTTKKIRLTAGQENVQLGASDSEMALAGKGFNEQVETEYRSQNKQANYAAVDQMEKAVITEDEMAAFITAGNLQGGR